MRAWIAALLLNLFLAAPAGAVGFLTQNELVGRDGDTLIVLPPYTYVTVIQHFGEHAIINYRLGDTVHELRVSRLDLDAVRPDEADAAPSSERDTLAAFYRERVPFDIYIDEVPATVTTESGEDAAGPASYRMRIKTCNLTPETVSNIRIEVHVYFDEAEPHESDALWQLRIMSAKPREFKTVQTPLFSADTVRDKSTADAADAKTGKTAPPTKTPPATAATESAPERAAPEETAAEPAEAPGPPTMRYSVRLFVDEMFVSQRSGIVKPIDEETDEDLWNAAYGPRRWLHPGPQGQRMQ
jgi:hypothetical protein